MIKIYYFFILFLLSTLSFNKTYSIENKIVVKVDNEIITTLDIKKESLYLETLNSSINKLSPKQIYEVSKNSLIREKIKKKAIIKNFNSLKIEDEILDPIIKKMYNELNLDSKDELINFLNSKKLSFKNVEEKITNEILWNRLIYFKYRNQIKINEIEIEKQIKKQNTNLKQYLLQEVLFEVGKDEDLKTKNSIIKKNINEIGFEKTALLFSISDTSKNGGIIGWVNENSLNKKILNEINKLNIGDYTRPITIPGGFLILKIMNKKNLDQKINFKEEIEKIKKEKINQQLNQFSIIFYNKIKKNAEIKEL